MPSKDYTVIRVHKDVRAALAAAQKARGLDSPNETLRDLLALGLSPRKAAAKAKAVAPTPYRPPRGRR